MEEKVGPMGILILKIMGMLIFIYIITMIVILIFMKKNGHITIINLENKKEIIDFYEKFTKMMEK